MIEKIKKILVRRKLDNAVENYMRNVNDSMALEKESLCYSFLKETGLKASQCEIVQQNTLEGTVIRVRKIES